MRISSGVEEPKQNKSEEMQCPLEVEKYEHDQRQTVNRVLKIKKLVSQHLIFQKKQSMFCRKMMIKGNRNTKLVLHTSLSNVLFLSKARVLHS